MTFDPKLAAKQDAAVQRMLLPECDGGVLLAFDMGLGKTRTGCMFLQAYNAEVALVVVPLQTIEDWEKTANEMYPGMPVYQINSTAPGKKALADFQWRKRGIYLLTQQYWERLAWVTVAVPKRRKDDEQKYRKQDSGVWAGGEYVLIYDESHRSANTASWTHKALMNLTPWLEGGPFKLSMSGTFMGDSFDGAYGATRWIWPHRLDIIPSSIFAWRKMWAETVYDHFAPKNEKVVGELVPGAFVASLPCYIREESNVPPPKTYEVLVDLYPEQRRVYDELDDHMVAWIEENPLVAEYSITKRARQRQTTLAMPTLAFSINEKTGDEDVAVSFDDDAESAKVDELFADIEGRGTLGSLLVDETLLVLTDSQKFARLLTRRLNGRYGAGLAKEWSGKVRRKPKKRDPDGDDRATVKADFIAGKIRFLVGVQSAMGTGTDGLQYTDARTIVFMSRSDRRIDNEQGVSRLNRTGQRVIVRVVSYIARNTVDTGQWSNQMKAAVAMSKMLRKKAREEERERIRAARHQHVRGFE